MQAGVIAPRPHTKPESFIDLDSRTDNVFFFHPHIHKMKRRITRFAYTMPLNESQKSAQFSIFQMSTIQGFRQFQAVHAALVS